MVFHYRFCLNYSNFIFVILILLLELNLSKKIFEKNSSIDLDSSNENDKQSLQSSIDSSVSISFSNSRSNKYLKILGTNFQAPRSPIVSGSNKKNIGKASKCTKNEITSSKFAPIKQRRIFYPTQVFTPPLAQWNRIFMESVSINMPRSALSKFKSKVTVPREPKLFTASRVRAIEEQKKNRTEVFTPFKARPMPNFAQLHARNEMLLEKIKEKNRK